MTNPTPLPTRRFFLRRPGPMFRRLSYVIGAVVVATGVLMVPAVITSFIYREWETAGNISLSAVAIVVIGWVGWRVVGESGTLTTREGFATASRMPSSKPPPDSPLPARR